jgi:hypothetical protein
MIVRKLKEVDELQQMLQNYKRVAIIGCAGCYGEGGVKGVKNTAAALRERGINIVAEGFTGRQCAWMEWASEKGLSGEEAITNLAKNVELEKIKSADAFLSLACAVGAQTLLNFVGNRALLPGFNTFLKGRREGEIFKEQCLGCGNCMIHRTGGLCPVTKCPKSDMNGPCGGVRTNGNCEVHPDRECIWLRIYRRLKEIGELDRLKERIPEKDFSLRTHPRTLPRGGWCDV